MLYPEKNFIIPFSKWTEEEAAGISYSLKTDSKVIIDFNAVSQYVGLLMPIDMKIFDLLRGKTVTFSGTIDRYGTGSSQVQMRFYGGASGNADFVLSSGYPAYTSKKVPTDFTGVFIKIQSNIIGKAKISVENLQLEISDSMTSYKPYKLGLKPAELVPKTSLFDAKDFESKKTQGAGNTYMYAITGLKANTDYTVSTNAPYTLSNTANVYLNGSSTESNGVKKDAPRTMKSSANGSIYLLIRYDSEAYRNVLSGKYWIRVEEGTKATPPDANKPATLYYEGNLLDVSKTTAGYFVNDTTGQLSISGAGSTASEFVGIEGGKTYVLDSFVTTFSQTLRYAFYDTDKKYIRGGLANTGDTMSGKKELTAPANAKYIRFSVFPQDFNRARFYEKGKGKIINKTATLYPQKNLIDSLENINSISYLSTFTLLDKWSMRASFSNVNSFLGKVVSVKPNTNYVFSAKHNGKIAVYGLSTSTAERIATYTTDQSVSFNSGNRNEVRLIMGASGLPVGDYDYKDVQLEEGTTPTAFKPYKVGLKPAVLYPKKNLIDLQLKNIEQGVIDGNGTWTTSDNRIRYKMFIPVEPNKDYTFSLEGIDLNVWYWAFAEFSEKATSGTQTSNSGWLTSYSRVTKTKPNTRYIGFLFSKRSNPAVVPSDLPYNTMKMQLEAGLIKTAYEPYKLINKPL